MWPATSALGIGHPSQPLSASRSSRTMPVARLLVRPTGRTIVHSSPDSWTTCSWVVWSARAGASIRVARYRMPGGSIRAEAPAPNEDCTMIRCRPVCPAALRTAWVMAVRARLPSLPPLTVTKTAVASFNAWRTTSGSWASPEIRRAPIGPAPRRERHVTSKPRFSANSASSLPVPDEPPMTLIRRRAPSRWCATRVWGSALIGLSAHLITPVAIRRRGGVQRSRNWIHGPMASR